MIRYTTPTITLTIEKTILPMDAEVYVTIQQGNRKLTKKDPEIERGEKNTIISLTLTQQESAAFDSKEPAFVQVNWITADGVRSATKSASVFVFDNLLTEVVNYGG